tara:strand:+ start:71 stop:214 length:144 start_codon:yes stop_codon:yes gene_type:complete
MKLIFKLLLGLGRKEEFNPTPLNILFTAILLLGLFFSVVWTMVYFLI